MERLEYGTVIVYRKQGERPCERCRLAENAYHREHRNRSQRARDYIRGYNRAARRASTRLINAHREEYERYLDDEYAREFQEQAS